jgi:hypothetical protein
LDALQTAAAKAQADFTAVRQFVQMTAAVIGR